MDPGNNSRQLALSPQASICPPPLLGHHFMVTSLLDWSKVIIRPMKDGNGKRTFDIGPIVTMSCHPWDSNAKVSFHFRSRNHTEVFPLHIEQNPPNPPRQDSPVQCMPHEQTPRQPTPGPKPSQHNEPSIFGLRDIPTCEPEPEVAPTQSMEEPFAHPATPRSIIIIHDTPLPFLLRRLHHLPLLPWISLPLPPRTQLPPPPL
ncbi:hypothetical protein O181_081742 [Austropuccinia psidii MF-1]|uniref:Uncharacterized protein n=1 Tax=Austropuccinia psidii MF-1 TaxID=1389203 RepID=A0A9Q3FRA1_9BASI|nr:hypothetical protein [Austropuccinia psidii MF-1]